MVTGKDGTAVSGSLQGFAIIHCKTLHWLAAGFPCGKSKDCRKTDAVIKDKVSAVMLPPHRSDIATAQDQEFFSYSAISAASKACSFSSEIEPLASIPAIKSYSVSLLMEPRFSISLHADS